jgi:hypothetical protein
VGTTLPAPRHRACDAAEDDAEHLRDRPAVRRDAPLRAPSRARGVQDDEGVVLGDRIVGHPVARFDELGNRHRSARRLLPDVEDGLEAFDLAGDARDARVQALVDDEEPAARVG